MLYEVITRLDIGGLQKHVRKRGKTDRLQELTAADRIVALRRQQIEFGARGFRLLLVEIADRPVAGLVEGRDLLQQLV